MNTTSDGRNPVELLAEDFLDRKRRGEQPTLDEYIQRHPELAEQIRDLFPALLMIEGLGESSGATSGSLADDGAVAAPRLRQLGDYRILREIGRGGMGVVYEAEQESLGRRVALKVLSAGSLLDPKQVRRFEREAKAAAKLHHTNIVPVFGVGRQDGHHYFVMQFIAGVGLDVVLEDLRRLRHAKSEASSGAAAALTASPSAELSAADVARSLISGRFQANAPLGDQSMTEPLYDSASAAPTAVNGPTASSSSAILPGSPELSALSDPDHQFYRSIARIGIQAAAALEYANHQGILHRDVKPSNLLLDNHGNVWVADFGLAKTAEADDLTHTGDILGTIRYMAPERFSGHCDARSDVYSLGLTLYELAALRPAFEAADRHALIERVLHEEPERLKKRAPSVPRDLETIIAKASARDPAVRYTTAAALAEDLARFVEDRPVLARRVGSAERLWRWCRRNPWLSAATGVAAAALIGATAVSIVFAISQTRAADHLSREQAKTSIALNEAKRITAGLVLDKGIAQCEQGDVARGVLWQVRALAIATEVSDQALQRAIRTNLGGWSGGLRPLKAMLSQPGEVNSIAFGPDGKTVASGGSGGTVCLWDVATERPTARLLQHPGDVLAVAFSPDGRSVLTGAADGVARLWDTAAGSLRGDTIRHADKVVAVAFRPDGRAIVTAAGGSARLWDVATGEPIGKPLQHGATIEAVAFRPDGEVVLTGGSDGTAQLWDASTGLPIGGRLRHQNRVTSVAFSPDGETLLTGCWDETAQLWDGATGHPIGSPLKHRDTLLSVAFSPDAKSVLAGGFDKTARLWDAASGLPIGSPLQHNGTVRAVAFAPDGKTILTACEHGPVRLWEARLPEQGPILRHDGEIVAVAISPDAEFVLTAGKDRTARLWRAATGEPIGEPVRHQDRINVVAFSPDGKTFLTGCHDGAIRLWETASRRPIGPPMRQGGPVYGATFHPSGTLILSGSRDGEARVWESATGRPVGEPLRHAGWVHAVAYNPAGTTILTGCEDGSATQWDASTRARIGPAMKSSEAVRAVAFSPDGKTILTGSWDGATRIWNAATGLLDGGLQQHHDRVLAVAFGPDGKTFATGDADKSARFWDIATGKTLGPPIWHHDYVRAIALYPDGRSVVTGSFDRTARFSRVPVAVTGSVEQIELWMKTITGEELDDGGAVTLLDAETWRKHRDRLKELGGPPMR